MSDTGLTVPGMTELPRRYDVTITVDRDGGYHPEPRRVRRGGRAVFQDARTVTGHE